MAGPGLLHRLRRALAPQPMPDAQGNGPGIGATIDATIDWGELSPGTDWAWRPPVLTQPLPDGAGSDSGGALPGGPGIWHDLPDEPFTLTRQPGAGLPFVLCLQARAAAGQGYVALSFDLPGAVLAGLDTGFVLQARTRLRLAAPADCFLRLNIEHGPNTERILRHLDLTGAGAGAGVGGAAIETGFDLGFVEMNPRRLVKIWLDLIVEKPGANRIELHDLLLSRHRRADM